jgi:hypothetical protein
VVHGERRGAAAEHVRKEPLALDLAGAGEERARPDKPRLRAAVQQKLASVGRVDAYPGFPPGNTLLSAHPQGFFNWHGSPWGPASEVVTGSSRQLYGPKRHPALTWPECARGDGAERGNPGSDVNGEATSGKTTFPPRRRLLTSISY